MENLDRILVVDADGHVNEGDVDISARLPEAWRSQGPVSLKDNHCHWDCNFPDSVRDICQARDLSLTQKERILGRNAVEFFGLGNLPDPNAVKVARAAWTREAAAEGVLR